MRPRTSASATLPDAGVYSRDYFLSPALDGLPAYQAGSISIVRRRQLEQLEIKPGHRVLDIGCGRGDVVAELVRQGIDIVGVDYSWDAVRLSGEALGSTGAVVQGDAVHLPFRDGAFDAVLMADIIEHLPWAMAVDALREARRITKPDGRLVIHTAPNTWFVAIVMPLLGLVMRLLRRAESVDRFTEYNRLRGLMHPNELNPLSFRRLLREAGLDARSWVDDDVMRSGETEWTVVIAKNPLVRLAARVAAMRPLLWVMGNDLYAVVEPLVGRR